MAPVLALTPVNATASCTGYDGSENFETYPANYPPAYATSGATCFYTHGLTTGGIIVNTPPGSPGTIGTKTYYVNNDLTQFNFDIDAGVTSLCAAGMTVEPTFDFDFRTTATAPTGGTTHNVHGVYAGSGANAAGVGYGFDGTFTPRLVLRANDGVNGQQSYVGSFFGSPPALAADTWYHASFNVRCNYNGRPALFAAITIAGTTYGGIQAIPSPYGGFNGGIPYGLTYGTFSFPDSGSPGFSYVNSYLDNIRVSGFTTAGVPSASFTAPSGANIVGVDSSIDGANVIYRYTGGGCASGTSCVATLNGQSLTANIATSATNCNRVDLVAAGLQNVVFGDCTGNTAQVASLKILEPDLADTFVPPGCNFPEDEADSWAPSLTGINQLVNLEFGGVDYNLYLSEGQTHCRVFAVLGFSDLDGKVGFSTFIKDSDILTGTATTNYRTQYAPSGVFADDIALCQPVAEEDLESSSTSNGDAYLIAVGQELSTKVYNVLNGNVNLVSTGTGSLGAAKSVSCTGSTTAPALLQTVTGLYGFNYRTGAVAWSKAITGGLMRGSTESWDGKWGAVYDNDPAGAKIRLLNMTTGAYVGNLTPPSGTIKWMKLDSTGQNLFVQTDATLDQVLRFDVHGSTTIVPVAAGDPTPGCLDPLVCDPTTQPGSGSGGGGGGESPLGNSIFGGLIAAGGGLFGGSEAIGGILVSVLLILGFAVIGYGAVGESLAGASIGGTLGLVLSVSIGIFPLWPIIVACLVAAAIIIVKSRGG